MLSMLKKFVKKNRYIENTARNLRNIRPLTKRLSSHFWDYYALLNETQYYEPQYIQELQFELLKNTLKHAYLNSKFYRNLYDKYGVKISQIQSFEDFRSQIPIVDKSLLKNAGGLTIKVPDMYKITTSGTSGAPFQFYGDRESREKELAAIYHQWSRANFTPDFYRIEMRGFQIEPIAEYPDLNLTRFSIVNMNDNMEQMVNYINEKEIAYFHGYPSAIAKFAKLLNESSLKLISPIKGVLLASENMYEWQIKEIEDYLNPEKIIAHYGNSEQVALGAWCETNRSYHFLPLYGYVEKGLNNELIGTGFLNKTTPFIRYRMNDLVLDWTEEVCPQCGRGYTPVIKQIGGRLEDYLIDEKSELIPPAVVTFPFKNLNVMKEVQVFQIINKNIILRYTIQNSYDREKLKIDKNQLTIGFKTMLGESIDIFFEEVVEITLTDACKFKWIISEAHQK
ncbi:phenylacetate--CoA ligase family protein [Sporomusa acidovorans]|uniref:Phenylacetate--CoA ligase family protein n=1 Tax=Sporomusa acidovorans (strain ATCC 49682 / DSM 3132 / Mol) TaxID=1123286 RepID=A0ABZ3J8C7_SPOA4|nr:phenylacetate--CoA ligase family protein [Sporomusa acidovorans]OZC19338.1 hypothetical protein SPACI_29280 [Sporomusa acidovorans DSM 3132]SDD80338.1 phenylacetate-CoA ligase [Sporomusa acidovorans]